MDYKSRIEDLFRRHRSVQTSGFSSDAYKSGLEGIVALDNVLGHPHQRYRTVHVAGTNGKGSVCSMIASALAANGYRTGLYTSPHLISFRERMKILEPSGGIRMIPEEEVCAFLDEFDMDGLTFFEITTGMAFKWFADRGVDFAVIETGLGGRLDSTNVITPEVSVISSIGLDHCALLGNTLQAIAAEKAGIFKRGVPAVVWGRESATAPVFEKIAARTGAPLHFASDFYSPLLRKGNFTDLQGPCQETNLRTALAALALLGIPAMGATEDALAHTASRAGLRARWEILLRNPLTICDIAHNLPALASNFRRLESLRLEPPADSSSKRLFASANVCGADGKYASKRLGPYELPLGSVLSEAEQTEVGTKSISPRFSLISTDACGSEDNSSECLFASDDVCETDKISSKCSLTSEDVCGADDSSSKDSLAPEVVCGAGDNSSKRSLASDYVCEANGQYSSKRLGPYELPLERVLSVAKQTESKQTESEQTEEKKKRPLLVVFGMMADKDVDSVAALLPVDAQYFLVAPGTPRAMKVKDLALKLKNLNFTESGTVERGVSDALAAAGKLKNAIVYIGGSNYVAAEAIEYIEQI